MPSTTAVRKTKAAATAPVTITLPALEKGEEPGGILLKKGKPSHHVIILPGDFEGDWDAMMAKAKKLGGDLPSPKEQSLLRANAGEHFKPTWYWSNEKSAHYADYAWLQDFFYGDQYGNHTSLQFRARAVRRVAI